MSDTAPKIRINNHNDFPLQNKDLPYTEISAIDFRFGVHEPYLQSEFLTDEAAAWLDIVQKYDYKILSRTADFGSKYDFSSVVFYAENIINIFRSIDIANIMIFSIEQLHEIINNSKEILELFGNIMNFDPNNNESKTRDELILELRSLENNVINKISFIVGYASAFKSNIKDEESLLTKLVKSYELERDKNIKELNDKKIEVNEILTRIKEASALSGIVSESRNFSDQSDLYDLSAKEWSKKSWKMGIGTILFSFLSSFSYKFPFIKPENNIESAQLISGKIIIIGILSYGLLNCIRNYTAQTHNAVINKHRQNSIQTYRAFIDAASTNVTRDIVLTHAAAAVFSHQDTGYVKNQDTSGAHSFIEMIPKSMVGDTKPG